MKVNMKIKMAILSILLTFSPVFAGTFDNITTIINEMVAIFPAILNLIIAVIPIMIILGLAGFVLKVLDTILDTVRRKTRM